MLQILFPWLKEKKENAKFSWCRDSPRPPTVFGTNQTFLPTLRLQHFPNHWSMKIFFFFYFSDRPWYSDSDQWPTDQLILYLYSLFGQPVFCSIFILSKNKGFGLELYWKCLFHLLSWRNLVNNKNTLKKCRFQLSNFKYNKNKKQKLQQKLLTQWFSGFNAIRFFNWHHVFLNFQ